MKNLHVLLLFKGFPCLDSSFFQFKNTPTLLCLCRDKIKKQFGKNTTLTLTKTLPKKQGPSPVNFQITLSIYKLDYQNKKIYIKNKDNFWGEEAIKQDH